MDIFSITIYSGRSSGSASIPAENEYCFSKVSVWAGTRAPELGNAPADIGTILRSPEDPTKSKQALSKLTEDGAKGECSLDSKRSASLGDEKPEVSASSPTATGTAELYGSRREFSFSRQIQTFSKRSVSGEKNLTNWVLK